MRQFVCARCGAVNRSPDEKDPRAAKCGRCGAQIFTGQPIEVTGGQLALHRSSTKGGALLLDVWAPWCAPCVAMAPQLAAAAHKLEPEVRVLKVNSDAEPQVAQALGVRGIPALFLVADDHVIGRHAGLMRTDRIVRWVRHALADATASAKA
ncbi:MAG TPA: thioredoxin domain-containing protein [Caulobacteraceae bacterium]|nr:thioredoxin domain-containing protein [Caulobacteraceae bacterium]